GVSGAPISAYREGVRACATIDSYRERAWRRRSCHIFNRVSIDGSWCAGSESAVGVGSVGGLAMTSKRTVAAIRLVRQLCGWRSWGMMRPPWDTRKPIEPTEASRRPGRSVVKAEPPARFGALCAIVAFGVALAACSETVTKHGHLFQENDLKS